MVCATTPKEAKALGLVRYRTGKPCKNGHVAYRRVSDRTCVECGPQKQKKHYHLNRDAYLEKQRAWQEDNRDKARAASSQWKRDNIEAVAAYQSAYYDENKVALAEKDRTRRLAEPEKQRLKNKAWNENNRGRRNAFTAQRMVHVKRATPAWLTAEDKIRIQQIYKEAAEATKRTGVKHHVDHIIPLRGETVSGLHVPSNLRAITATENSSKKNKFDQMLLG